MDRFLQTLIDALAVGSLYALIALGYTMVYGILKFINFAHSDVFVLGAWLSFGAASVAGFGQETGAAVAPWVLWAVGGAYAAAATALGFEAATWRKRHPDRGFSFMDTTLAATLTGVALWASAALALVYASRWAALSGDSGLVAGPLILVCSMLTCGLAGFVIERLAYKPLRKAPRLNVLITAIGISLFLQNIGQLDAMFGTRPQPMPALLPREVPLATLGGVKIWPVDVIGAVTAVFLMLGLDFLVHRTKFGRAMRAVSFSPTTASLMGIDVNRVISVTFVIGASLAAAAGFLYAQKYSSLSQTAAATWVLLGLKAFVAAVVGGIGNIRGAMLGGLLIGLLEFFGAAFVSSELKDVYVFSLLVLVLLFRPSGLLGRAVMEKV